MSTRATIRFATREKGVTFNEHPKKWNAQLYRHHDGYPEGLGLDIAKSLLDSTTINGWEIEYLDTCHGDLNIEGEKPDRALVLYISPRKIDELHGTALWRHKKYGKSLPDTVTNEEFDRMILKESENLDNWTLDSVIGYEQNRAISYPANYFHSKYPNKSWKSGREVFVMFYKTIK